MLSCCSAAKEDEKLASVETQPALPASALAKATAEEEVAMKVKVAKPVAPKKEVEPAPAPVKQEPTREFIAREFTLDLQKEPGKALGFELDPLDTKTLHIVNIQEDGLIADHNRSCSNPADKVLSGDVIVSINGVGGSNDPMVDCLKKNSNLKIVLRRLTTWEVTLQQKGNSIRSCLNRATNGILLRTALLFAAVAVAAGSTCGSSCKCVSVTFPPMTGSLCENRKSGAQCCCDEPCGQGPLCADNGTDIGPKCSSAAGLKICPGNTGGEPCTENRAFTDWNMANPSKDIRPNDRII